MRLPTHVTVTAPEGRLTPIHPQDGTDLGGAPLRVRPGEVRRVAWSQTTRRAVTAGDLILCTPEGRPVRTAIEAESAADLPNLRAVIAPDASAARTPTPDMQAAQLGGKS